MSKNAKLILLVAILSLGAYLSVRTFLKSRSGGSSLSNEVVDMTKPWVLNTLHGFSFETPEPVKREKMNNASGYDSMITNLDVYIFRREHLVTMFIHMETNFKEYDTEKGLHGSIQNAVSLMGGKKLELDFTQAEGNAKHHLAEGEYQFKGNPVSVRGYSHWNENGKVLILITLIGKSEANDKVIQKIIDSRKIQGESI